MESTYDYHSYNIINSDSAIDSSDNNEHNNNNNSNSDIIDHNNNNNNNNHNANVKSTISIPTYNQYLIETDPLLKRWVSLDTLRGLAVFCLLIVNNSVGSYRQTQYALWNGVFLGDFVVACFMFLLGCSISVSIVPLLYSSKTKISIMKKVLKRSIILFFLGLLLDGGKESPYPSIDLMTVRIMGPLQRIAISYFIVSSVVMFVNTRRSNSSGNSKVAVKYFGWWLVALSILVVYLGILYGVKIPWENCKRRSMTSRSCNVASYLDNIILRASHIPLPIPPDIHGIEPYGLLATFNSTFSTFLGLYFGMVLFTLRRIYEKYHSSVTVEVSGSSLLGSLLKHWGAFSAILFVLGLVLHFSVMPMNRTMYNPSYAFFMAGISSMFILVFFLILDTGTLRRNKPYFVVFRLLAYLGMNSLFVFIADGLILHCLGWDLQFPEVSLIYYGSTSSNLGQFLSQKLIQSIPNEDNGKLTWGLCNACVWIFVTWVMFKKRVFFKV